MYGLAISTGIFISALLAESLAKKDGRNLNIFWNGLMVGLLCGIAGARLYHVLHYFELYSQNPISALSVHKGGLGIPGGIAAGITGVIFYLKYKKEEVLYWLDLAALVLPLGQAVGRWGNYFNRELMPYALYESAANLILFLLLFSFYKTKTYPKGLLVTVYSVAYFLIIRVLLLGPFKETYWII